MQKYISLKGRFLSLLNRTKYKFKIKIKTTSIYFNLHVHIKDYKSCEI